jgi:CO/xanthine dehydrogenase FAD-binding subunit
MNDLEQFAHPRSVEEALALLAAGRDQARPLAGGTGLVLAGGPRARVLVDLSRAGLDAISLAAGELRLGAMATIQATARSRAVVDACVVLIVV